MNEFCISQGSVVNFFGVVDKCIITSNFSEFYATKIIKVCLFLTYSTHLGQNSKLINSS